MVTTTHSETMTAANALAVYGKSFHWARRFLGQHMGMKAERLYQFCRVLDDMADGDIEHGPKRLHRIRKDLLTAGTANDPLLTHFQPFLTKQKFPTKVIVALIDEYTSAGLGPQWFLDIYLTWVGKLRLEKRLLRQSSSWGLSTWNCNYCSYNSYVSMAKWY